VKASRTLPCSLFQLSRDGIGPSHILLELIKRKVFDHGTRRKGIRAVGMRRRAKSGKAVSYCEESKVDLDAGLESTVSVRLLGEGSGTTLGKCSN